MRCVPYTGTAESICPITLTPLPKIQSPVAFRTAPHQPYECKDLIEWLREKRVNPITNIEVQWIQSPLEIIGPLSLCKNPRHIQSRIEHSLNNKTVLDIFKNYGWAHFIVTIFAFSIGHWIHTLSIVYTLAHSIVSLKTIEGHIVIITGIYILTTTSILLNIFQADNLPAEVASISVLILKIQAHFVDIYGRNIYITV